jgi:hypothetical protein
MADEKVFKVKIDGVEREVKNLKDLKSALKDAKNEQAATALQFGEGSKQFLTASKNVSSLRDKIDDLTDSTRSLQGSGIEKASSGFNLLGEGLRNLDFDKVKVGLTAMKTALASTGIMLLVQGITYLIQNFDELSKGSGIVAKVLQFVGGVIDTVKDGVYFLTDALGLTNSELDKMGDNIVNSAEKTKEALSEQSKEFDRQIAAAKAAGKQTIELEIQKQENIIRTNKAILEQALAFVKTGGVLSEEQSKAVKQAIEENRDAQNQIKVIEATAQKDRDDKAKEVAKARKKDLDDKVADEKKAIKEMDDYRRKIEEQWYTDEKALRDKFRQSKFNDFEEGEDEISKSGQAWMKKNVDDAAAAAAKKKEIEKAEIEDTQATAQASIKATQDLSDFLFNLKMSKMKKGSAEELKMAKRQFQINKALALQSSIISGIQGVINALSAQSVIPEPYGTILKVANAVAVGIAATVNTAKIASTKFEAPGGDGDSGGGGAPAMPALPAPPSGGNAPTVDQSSTKLDDNGNNLSQKPAISVHVKADVLETEMTEKQERVERLENQSKIW